MSGCVVTIDLFLADGRKLSAAGGERGARWGHSEPLAELRILVCYRPFEVVACGGTHGRAGDEKRVQPEGRQYGKEERIADCRQREVVEAGSIGFGFGHENLLNIRIERKVDFSGADIRDKTAE